MNDKQRQARITRALIQITEAPDAIQVRAAAEFARGYLEGMLEEGGLSVDVARSLQKTAVSRRDTRLADFGDLAIQSALQQGAHDQIKRLLRDADRLNFWQAHDWYTGERTSDGEWRFFHAEGDSCKGASLREALDELQRIQPDLRGEMDDADAWEG